TETETAGRGLAEAIFRPMASGRSWLLDESYEYCRKIALGHYENFPVGSLLIPKRLRKHFYAIYAFARIADDFADEGYDRQYSESERLELLEEWRRMLRDSLTLKPAHPVFVALSHTVEQYRLPLSLFEDLISAFAQDVTKRRYNSFEELLDYCRRSANPIGRLILLLFGHRSEEMFAWSDAICTALQLANHWQDVAIDLDKDRIYIPIADLHQFGLDESSLRERRADRAFRELMRFEVERARELFRQGKPLCLAVNGRLGLELRAVWLGGWRILEAIERNDYDIFSRRPVLNPFDKWRVILRAIVKERFRRY
ncbi:MAG TPA: squalene synthase HpnC, partial [Blastocatellia bacterium]|nr:squalene synthase HpnC [Blastocatellia bacterium]